MFKGCYTALITPMLKNGRVDVEGLQSLIEFQISQRVSGVLAVGTTGESPTLNPKEQLLVIEKTYEFSSDKLLTIAGTGCNCTRKTLENTKKAYDIGVKAFLLVDPYYNGPSSLEIRREYVTPVAERFPDAQIIPYVIPGRTGTQLLPHDLAILHREHPNVRAVKEATGDFENMKLTRKLCGENFDILSGDDDKTFKMMADDAIKASGVISVVSNIAPAAVQKMTKLLLERRVNEALEICQKLNPLFQIVTVKTIEETSLGEVVVRARNPLPCKTLMNILGMPSGPLRPPLGKMTRKGLDVVLKAAREVYEKNPEILTPIENFFDVDLSERLYNEKCWKGLTYD
ncbi:4-hydroxy-tetrahydrodipicolinate synthase [Candidatus Bathyarchaeota archaeon]|nr:4-hydroxy-tetrahydrodipicolinate synthase [Candidatus Bathyarchaeota archaeon]